MISVQYTLEKDGQSLPCVDECMPDPNDLTVMAPDLAKVDKCHVQVGEAQELRPCVPIARADTIRKLLATRREAGAPELAQMKSEIDTWNDKVSLLKERASALKVKRDEYSKKVANVFKQKDEMLDLYKILKANVKNLGDLKKSVKDLETKLEKLEMELPTPRPGDCTGLPCYEKDSEGDGLYCKYFNNYLWMGNPLTRIDPEIKFFWSSEEPYEGINPFNFSIECEGYLRPPVSDSYVFICEADDGCLVEINGSVVLRDRIPEASKSDFLQEKKEYLEAEISQGHWDEMIRPRKFDEPSRWPYVDRSEPIPLDGGQYVPFKIKMMHSVHNSLFEDGNSYFYLFWQSSEIRKQIVPSLNMFTKIKENALKPKKYNARELALDTFLENEDAFMDKEIWKVRFIPPKLLGVFVLKTKYKSDLRSVEFSVGAPVRVYMAFQNDIDNPLDSGFKKTSLEISLLKIKMSDRELLADGKAVVSKDDVGLKVYYRDFPRGGDIKFKLALKDSALWTVLVAPGVKIPVETCGGDAKELSADEKILDRCEATSKQGEMGCEKALTDKPTEYWMASGQSSESITVKFKVRVKPQEIWIAQPSEEVNMATLIKVYISDTDFFALDADKGLKATFDDNPVKNWQKFMFEKTMALDNVRIEVATIKGGNNAKLKVKIYGIECILPEEIKKEEDKKINDHLGLRKKIPKSEMYKCTDDLSTLNSDVAWVNCIEPCNYKKEMDGIDIIEPMGETFTLDSKPCLVARKLYPDDNTTKDWGIRRMINFSVKVGSMYPPYLWKFDSSVIKEDKDFIANQEIDVLDDQYCYIRGKVKSVNDSSVVFLYEGLERTVMKDYAYYCGDKLPFVTCHQPKTRLIAFKFVNSEDVQTLLDNQLSTYNFDIGAKATQHGTLYYGWDNKNNLMESTPRLNELESDQMVTATGAVMRMKDDTWFVVVPNGYYDVKVHLKLIRNKRTESKYSGTVKNTPKFLINDMEHTTDPMGLDDEIWIDQPSLQVTSREIRLRWLEGEVSIVEITLQAQNPKKEVGGPKVEIGRNTWMGPACFEGEDALNCAFTDDQVKDVKNCPLFVKIPGNVADKNIACLNKCLKASYDTTQECSAFCPEKYECLADGEKFKCTKPIKE